MATVTTNPLDALLKIRDGNITARWNFPDAVGTSLFAPGGIGHAANVSFSFLTASPVYHTSTAFAPFTSYQQQAAREILASISTLSQLTFTEVSGVGTITFAMESQSSSGYSFLPSYAYSYNSNIITSVSVLDDAGDSWLNSSIAWTADDFISNDSGYGTLVHEIGHVLGLKHPFQADSVNGYILDSSLDSTKYTVMSYTDHPFSLYRTVTEVTPGNYLFQYRPILPETFMPFDIMALQYLYGTNTSFHSGNDTYTFETNRPFIKTIWDAGGNDTLSVSNFSLACTLDLRAGYYSSIRILSDPLPSGSTETHTGIYDGTDNLAIAYGTVIENATGGTGNDTLIGNQVDNILNGGLGADTMVGGLANDSYVVDNSNDLVWENENQGNDSVYVNLSYNLTNHVENLILTGTATINGVGNTLNNYLVGNVANNILNGWTGSDTINGGLGADTMIGGLANDSYVVDNSNDLVWENENQGIDNVYSSINYSLTNHVENLILTGTLNLNATGNTLINYLVGNTGNNILNGWLGADVMSGNTGNDSYIVENINDLINENINSGSDTVYSSVSYNLSANVENLILTGTATINATGNTEHNYLVGNTANNTLLGWSGWDTYIGGLGKDSHDLTEPTAVTDTIRIIASDSTLTNFDLVYGFQLGSGVINTSGVDRLDLPSHLIASNTPSINGLDTNGILSHIINNGIIYFDDNDNYSSPLVISSATNLNSVLSYLQNNIIGNNTAAFIADGNTYIFQDGTTDTLIELIGVTASSLNNTGLAAGSVWIM